MHGCVAVSKLITANVLSSACSTILDLHIEESIKATGCQVAIKQIEKDYENLKINPILATLYIDKFQSVGGGEIETGPPAASTDIGNVSHPML